MRWFAKGRCSMQSSSLRIEGTLLSPVTVSALLHVCPPVAQKRENVIKRSRDIQKLSKQVCGGAHLNAGGSSAHGCSVQLPAGRSHALRRLPTPLLQAIFSLHRGAAEEADQRLAAAKKAAEELLPTIKENPPLRQGSYSNASEAGDGGDQAALRGCACWLPSTPRAAAVGVLVRASQLYRQRAGLLPWPTPSTS